jgi:hypothetical protein
MSEAFYKQLLGIGFTRLIRVVEWQIFLVLTFAGAFSSYGETQTPIVTRDDIPVGIFIACSLVTTVDSSTMRTPVVGRVAEAVYRNQKLVIPQGTTVMCIAKSVPAIRDRIALDGKWSLALPTGDVMVDALVCDREVDRQSSKSKSTDFGSADGSAGLLGFTVLANKTGEKFVRVPAGKEFYLVTTYGQ